MSQTTRTLLLAGAGFVLLWLLIFLHHEWTISRQPATTVKDKHSNYNDNTLKVTPKVRVASSLRGNKPSAAHKVSPSNLGMNNIQFGSKDLDNVVEQNVVHVEHNNNNDAESSTSAIPTPIVDKDASTVNTGATAHNAGDITTKGRGIDLTTNYVDYSLYRHDAKRGELVCNGQTVDSEVIYWKIVPGDNEYESPITPHHGLHHDRYLSFEYDNGGWNNVRMGLESLIVVAHAMGRTLVVPPQQHLYLLYHSHKDPHDAKAHAQMGFEDFFDMELLRHHKGFNLMHMEEFLEKEAVTGGLKGVLPPQNSTKLWGQRLWQYMNKVADVSPSWQGRFVAFPKEAGDFNMSQALQDAKTLVRLKEFGGDRSPVFYDEKLQEAHHIHFPGHESYRLLQHHYAFAFFADNNMQSFYKRFVRDFMRYKDNIQCAGAELVALVRADAKKTVPESNGDYFALHIRRGDFQFKEVKHSAEDIVKHLHFPNGTAIIPPGAFVYISTDDPNGVCKDCLVMRKPCKEYQTPKPPGCPEDTSWDAFVKFGWKIRFLRDYLDQGHLADVNPNTHGMVESIVCSRAKAFAGTYFSTFTGYIHRLRGYHGLGEHTYYHSKDYVFQVQKIKSKGHGWSREWRTGWTDDSIGQLI